MLKKAASFVLASLGGSTYGKEYALASSLAAAALDGLFEHPAGTPDTLRDFSALPLLAAPNSFSTAC